MSLQTMVQLTSAAVADVAGSHAATTVARQTALGFQHFDDVVTDSILQSVEPPSAQPFHNSNDVDHDCSALTAAQQSAPEFHNSDDASNDCTPRTVVDFQAVQQFLLYTAWFDDSHAPHNVL